LRFLLPSETAPFLKQELTGKYDCVLSSWEISTDSTSDDRAFVVAYCDRTKLYGVVKFLKASGAAGIIVDRGEFIFEGSSLAFEAFNKVLRQSDSEPKSTILAAN
jgi:hypothetical protein